MKDIPESNVAPPVKCDTPGSWSRSEIITECDAPFEALKSFRAQVRSCSGFTLRDTRFSGSRGIVLPTPAVEHVRLAFLLESIGGHAENREAPHLQSRSRYMPRPIAFMPAGVSSWFYSKQGGKFRCALLSFDPAQLCPELQLLLERNLPSDTRLTFANERMWQLVSYLVAESDAPDQFSQLYCDQLSSMILIELARCDGGLGRQTARLTRARLARVVEYMEENPARRVRLSELASLTGLSVSHFTSAFKNSTGLSPYRWQLQSRIKKAQELLVGGMSSLADVAEATGFSDQSHLTRTFRRLTGATPARWLRDRRS